MYEIRVCVHVHTFHADLRWHCVWQSIWIFRTIYLFLPFQNQFLPVINENINKYIAMHWKARGNIHFIPPSEIILWPIVVVIIMMPILIPPGVICSVLVVAPVFFVLCWHFRINSLRFITANKCNNKKSRQNCMQWRNKKNAMKW